MIETYKGKRAPLESDADFQNASSIMERKTNQLVYVNSSKMLDAGIEICNWVVSFQAVQAPAAPEAGAAPGNQQFIQDSLIPLLKCLKSVKVVGINTLYTSNGIEQTFYARFEDKK